MALESVESNYVPADDGLIAGKNDSEPEEGEDLEDGEIADEDELEEGAIADDGDDLLAKKQEPPRPKPPERRHSPPKRLHEHDRSSPGGMFDHQRKKKRRPERNNRNKRNKRLQEQERAERMHEDMPDKFSHSGPDRRASPGFEDFPEGGGFNPNDDNGRMHKRKRMDSAEQHGGRKRNRRQSPDMNQRRDKPPHNIRKRPCMFYLQGKCHKGDNCPFLHTGSPERKFELCKFYLMDCCAKKEKCLYMHSDFPCKYFHTGMKCFAKENCKFSHEPLSDKTREILLKHIETAPKEILGDFPKLPRDNQGEVVLPVSIPPPEYGGVAPALLDYKIYAESGQSFHQHGDGGDGQGSSSSHFGQQSYGGREDFRHPHRSQHVDDHKHDKEEKEPEDVAPSFNFYRDINESSDKQKRSPRKSVRDDSDDENGLVIEDDREEDSSQRESGAEDVAVPSNLPKRQRELFLRIQHQQQHRDAIADAEDKKDNSDDEDKTGDQENWYSSDEEEAEDKNLTEVLKNLSKKDSDDSKSKNKTVDTPYDLTNINFTEDLTKLLSTIKPKPEPEVNRDPRARDPRSRPEPPKPANPCAGDIDLRIQKPPVQLDTDMRQNMSMFGDTDLRDLGPMTFKPPPLHAPCPEIDASFDSHPEIPFVLKAIPHRVPDYSGVRLNMMDPVVRMDPRLTKLVAKFDSSTASPMSPPSASSEPSRGDPRHRSAADPRMQNRQPTIIPTQMQQPPPQPPMNMEMNMANFMMMQMAAAASGGDNQGLMGAGPMGGGPMGGPPMGGGPMGGGPMGGGPMGMIPGMVPPMMQQGNFGGPNMQQMRPQHHQGGFQQHHRGGRGNNRGWRGGRGRGRGGGGFRGGRGWGKFDNDRMDRGDGSPANQTPEHSHDSDD